MFGASTGLSIEVSYPQDLVSKTALEYRHGSNDASDHGPTTIQNSFGSAHSFEVGALDGSGRLRVPRAQHQCANDPRCGLGHLLHLWRGLPRYSR
jgi:hypothetical protein